MPNPSARELVEKLAAFEHRHYHELVEQERQLTSEDAFTKYGGRDPEISSHGAVGATSAPERKAR